MQSHAEAREASIACGDDVAWYGATTPDVRYAYTYDSNGLLVHADGIYTADNSKDTIDYTWDAEQRFAHYVETNDWGSRVDIAETYQGENPVSYVDTVDADTWTYTYADYLAPWQPLHETLVHDTDAPILYTLAYDELGRLITATPSTGEATTWTYDDAARTITAVTGTWTDITTYGADGRELSESWSSTDPAGVEGSYTLDWNGDQLVRETYSSGTQDDPKHVQLIETDTMRYDCEAARTAVTTGRTWAASRARLHR